MIRTEVDDLERSYHVMPLEAFLEDTGPYPENTSHCWVSTSSPQGE